MLINDGLWLALGCAALAILFGIFSVRWVLSRPAGNERMQEIAAAIQEGARAYLNRQYTTIAIVGVVLFVIIGFVLNWYTAFGFAIGAIAGFLVAQSLRGYLYQTSPNSGSVYFSSLLLWVNSST